MQARKLIAEDAPWLQPFIEEAGLDGPLDRLRGIRQLGYLEADGMVFRHSRYDHSMETAELAARVFPGNSALIIAALLHDIASCAGGDITKKAVDMPLHEEECAGAVIPRSSRLERALAKRGTSRKEILSIIREQNENGAALTLLDRIAYVFRDAEEISRRATPLSGSIAKSLKGARILLEEAPRLIRSIHSGVLVEDEEVFREFLRLRRILFQFYLSPEARRRNAFAAPLIHAGYRSGRIPLDALLFWGDEDLERTLQAEITPPKQWSVKVCGTLAHAKDDRTPFVVEAVHRRRDGWRGIYVRRNQTAIPAESLAGTGEYSRSFRLYTFPGWTPPRQIRETFRNYWLFQQRALP